MPFKPILYAITVRIIELGGAYSTSYLTSPALMPICYPPLWRKLPQFFYWPDEVC